MANFDFNILSPHEFECLARDVLDVREAPLKFRTYSPGPDGGIDIACINSEMKIVAQVKLYQNNNFRKLKSALKNELVKVGQLEPDRYILITSVYLSPAQEAIIIEYFGKYLLSREDIIDRERLNKYLNERNYWHILKSHAKLLIPDMYILEYLLGQLLKEAALEKARDQLMPVGR